MRSTYPPPPPPPSNSVDRAMDELKAAVEAWDPPDALGFTKADYQAEDFDPLALLRNGDRTPVAVIHHRVPIHGTIHNFYTHTTNTTGPR